MPSTKKKNDARKSDKQKVESTDDQLPEDIRLAKEKLEKETGKKYKYRPQTDIPSIQDMLAHGAPEDQGKPKTWVELIGYPLILALLFFASFLIFVNAPHSKSRRHGHKFTLPKMPPKVEGQQQEPIVREQDEKPALQNDEF